MHLALKSAMSRIPYTNKVGETLGSIADSAAAYSLRALNGGDPMVARVRRSSDDAEKDFTASDMDSGSVADWVNGKQDTTLPCDVASAAAAYSLRSVNSNYTGSVVRVRRSSDNAEQDFTASDINSGSVVGWVNSAVDLVSSDLSDSTWTETGLGTATFSASGVSGGSGPRQVLSNKVFPQGTKVKVQINLTANPSNNTVLGVHFHNVNNGSLTAISANNASSRNIDSEFTLTADSKIRIRAEGGTTADWSFSNLSVTSILANGHVTTWYDQSGNGNNATQSTASSQPKIVDGGVLVSDGIDFDGSDDMLQTGTTVIDQANAGTISLFGVVNVASGEDGYLWGSVGPSSTLGTSLYARNDSRFALANGTNVFLDTIIRGGGEELVSACYSSDSANLRVNGGGTQTSVGGYNFTVNDEFTIGNREAGAASATFLNGSISEIIIYNTDQSSNRFKIESNINNHYGLYTNANDGFVTSWYDQSGNDNHATQSTAGRQPKIVDGGVLVSDGIEFDGVNDTLVVTGNPVITANYVGTYSAFTVQNTAVSEDGYIAGNASPSNGSSLLANNLKYELTNKNSASCDDISRAGGKDLLSACYNNGDASLLVNGSGSMVDSGTYDFSAGTSDFRIGSRNPNAVFLEGKIQEIIIFNSDQSANRAAIETNINNHYDIY